VSLRNQPSFTRRQIAEIQLAGIMNDPELALPHFANDKTIFDLDEVATRLQTQPWLIKRVLHAFGIFNMDFLSTRDVHILTRVLIGSSDVRILLFFNMIDMDGNRQVTKEKLTQFFTDYLDGIDSLKIFNDAEDGNHRQTIIKIILDKFHLNEASYIDFDQFHELVVSDQLLIEIFSKFTVHPTWSVVILLNKIVSTFKKVKIHVTCYYSRLSNLFYTLNSQFLEKSAGRIESLLCTSVFEIFGSNHYLRANFRSIL
jgi:hypothetical protein